MGTEQRIRDHPKEESDLRIFQKKFQQGKQEKAFPVKKHYSASESLYGSTDCWALTSEFLIQQV